MAIFARVSRLFRADLNAVLDQLEEPSELLRQSIRDMQQALQAQQLHHSDDQRELTDLDRRDALITSRLSEINSQLDLCLDQDDDSLARPLIRRKLQTIEHQSILTESRERITARLEKTAQAIATNESRLAEMQEKLNLFEPRPTDEFGTESDPGGITENDIQVALLREKQAREHAGGAR